VKNCNCAGDAIDRLLKNRWDFLVRILTVFIFDIEPGEF
jgi:hypothetical protein